MPLFHNRAVTIAAAVLAALLAWVTPVLAHPVLMISIDGLRADDVTQAKARGMNQPTFQAMMANGAWAQGVRPVLPSVTYPDHTTLVTGVAPARHGIANNTTFDPMGRNQDGWYWYASDIQVPTLFDAVKAKGGVSAAFGWPVTVGSTAITDNVPEFWRAGTPDDLKLLTALSTPGLIARIEKQTGISLADTYALTLSADAAKAKFIAAVIADDHPLFTALHLNSLDEVEHEAGPGSPAAKENLEKLDAIVGQLIVSARLAEPDLVVALVSDHGFAPVSHAVNLIPAFVQAGLITLTDGKVSAWRAVPWYADGSSAIVLAQPDDAALKEKVRTLLDKIAADSQGGITQVIGQAQIAAFGGSPKASFWVNYAPGFMAGKAVGGPLVTPAPAKGAHGYFPDWSAMAATFVIAGPGMPKGRDLGPVDMRAIAPTLAGIMGVALPTAVGRPLFAAP